MNVVSNAVMDTDEIGALYQCKDKLRSGIDPVLVASQLLQRNRLSNSVYKSIFKMFEEGRDRTEISEHLLSNIPFYVNISDLTQTLYDCGYTNLSSKLYLTFLRIKGNTPGHVQKSRSGQTASVNTLFRQLKRMVHDAQLADPRGFLNELANRYIHKMNREKDVRKQQLIADRCAAVIAVQIDAIGITFDSNFCSNSVFDQMKRIIPKTSNTLILEGLYYGRLANANAIGSDFESGEDMLVAARSRAYMTGPCLELVQMLYLDVYFKLWQYEKYPTKVIQESLLLWGRIGLESLEEEEVDTRALWRRMFILRMVFCLLGIGNKTNIIPGCRITEANISEAEKLLADIDRNWTGIETRRQMFYFAARARLSELKGDSQCLLYVKRAEALAREGNFTEIQFIEEHRKHLANIQGSERSEVFMCLEDPPISDIRDQTKNNETNNSYGQTSLTQATQNFLGRHLFSTESFDNCIVRSLDERSNLPLASLGLRTEMSQTENKEYIQMKVHDDNTGAQYHEILNCETQTRREEDLGQPVRSECRFPDHIAVRQHVSSQDGHVPWQNTAGIPETFSDTRYKYAVNQEQTERERSSDLNDTEEIHTSSENSFSELGRSCNFNSVVLFESRGEASGRSDEEPVFANVGNDNNQELYAANDRTTDPPSVYAPDTCREDQISIKSDDLFGD